MKARENAVKRDKGYLRIGNDWNAITIIALSQNNPLKAVAEFVENSIDAGAGNITIIRGKEKGEHYFRIIDDGEGLPCAEDGRPDFKYVATHICDSLKRRLKEQGARNIQGEFGIGLLSFWTIGHKLSIISAGKDGKTYQMVMEKGRPGYTISHRHHLFSSKGAQLRIAPLLEGIRFLSGEKIHRYLASELRDRLKSSGAKVKIIDRTARQEFDVQPRKYSGQLLHSITQINTGFGDIYIELYAEEKRPENFISLFRSGTRVIPNIVVLDEFQGAPWASGYFQGIIDAPFLNITPGTRDGIIRDEKFAVFCDSLAALKERLLLFAEERDKAEDELISANILRSVQKALREAILVLPPEEYDWFDIQADARPAPALQDLPEENSEEDVNNEVMVINKGGVSQENMKAEKQFFEFPGPLFSARIQPASILLETGKSKALRAVGLDRKRRQIEEGLCFSWAIIEGDGGLDKQDGEIVVFKAPNEPGLTRVSITVKQGDVSCETEAVITVVEHLIKRSASAVSYKKGLPGYTLERMPGQVQRSRFDEKRNIVVINSGHRDFVFASGQGARKLRYICRLFAKELVLRNFIGLQPEQLLERLIELSMYTEENLR